MRKLIFIIPLIVCQIYVNAQDVITASGTYTHHANQTMNPIQAKAEAVHQAKLYVIAKNFGTSISSTAITQLSNIDGRSSSSSVSIGESSVNGEWLETIGEPVIKQEILDGTIVTTVSIKGKIRKISSSTIEIMAIPLSDATNQSSECYEFHNQDNFYLMFKAPVNGYLAIYLSDNEYAYRLLPEKGNDDGSFKTAANRSYCFFDGKSIDGEYSKMLHLTTNKTFEINHIYVIFSKDEFTKAIDSTAPSVKAIPVLPWNKFQKWLAKCKTQDKNMVVKGFDITIKK